MDPKDKDNGIDIKAALVDFQLEFREKIGNLKAAGLIDKGQLDEALERLSKINVDHEGFQVRLRQLELRSNRANLDLNGGRAVKTMGASLVESEGYKEFVERGCKRFDRAAEVEGLNIKALSTTGDGGDMVDPVRRDGLVNGRTRPLRLIDLMTVIPTANGSVEYIVENYWHELQALVDSSAASGQKVIPVDNTYGFYPGQVIYLARGAVAEESRTVDTVDHDAGTVTVTANLTGTHAVGVKVTSNTYVFTPETKLSPMAGLEVEKLTATAKTIKSGVPITKQLAKDAPALMTYINARLPAGVELQIESQLINGDGTAEQFQGILSQTGIQTITWSSGAIGDTKYDALRRGITLSTLAFYPVEAVVVHPTDWEEMEKAKATDGHYLMMHAGAGAPSKQAWRLPVVETPVMPYGTAVLGAFSMACTVWDVDALEVMIYDQHIDWAAKGLLLVQAEKRLIFTIERPISLVKITFNSAPA